jgi:hypothetical protein
LLLPITEWTINQEDGDKKWHLNYRHYHTQSMH